MSKFKTVILQDLLQNPIRDFGSFSLTNLINFKTSGIPFFKSESIQDGYIDYAKVSYITEDVHKQLYKSVVNEGDLLYTKIGAICRGAIYDGRLGICNSNAATVKIKIDNKKANNEYILYLLLSDDVKREFEKSIISTPPRINLGDINRLILKIPSIAEQKKIAKILLTCDSVIEKTKEAIKKYQAIKDGMMDDLFTRGIDPVSKKLRPSYKDAPELYKKSDLGMIPEEWEVKMLFEIGEFKNGLNKDKDSFGFGIPFVNIIDAYSYKLNQSKLGLLNATKIEQMIYKLYDGDIIFVRSSVKPQGVGYNTLYNDEGKLVLYCGFMIRFRIFYKSEYLPEFYNYFFRYTKFRQMLINVSTVSANTNINQENLNLLKAIKLSVEEQSQIIKRLNSIDIKIQIEQNTLKKYEQIKKGLMDDLLTGKKEVEVKE